VDDGDEQRLVALVNDLVRAHATPGTRLPRVSESDAAEIAEALHGEFDAAVEARDEYAAANDLTIACGRGCNACCRNLVPVHEPEAIAVARWLSEPENAAVRDAFVADYPRWRAEIGDVLERSRTADAAGRKELLFEVWARQVLCAFNRDGLCSIYPVRPSQCRVAHALDTSDHCGPGSGDNPSVIKLSGIDRLAEQIRPVLQTAHVASGGPRNGPSPLCEAVHRRLSGS
jgi:Fe-S-cluster containining protein